MIRIDYPVKLGVNGFAIHHSGGTRLLTLELYSERSVEHMDAILEMANKGAELTSDRPITPELIGSYGLMTHNGVNYFRNGSIVGGLSARDTFVVSMTNIEARNEGEFRSLMRLMRLEVVKPAEVTVGV